MIEISVFTPTFNRAYILENLYNSLLRQKKEINFEWIVIDDGSTDNTEQKVYSWMKNKNNFEIVYEKQKNSGKHVAINRGIQLAKGRLFFIVDSDDYITDNALKEILKWEETIKSLKKFAGVAGLRGIDEKNIIGKTFKQSFIDASSIERDKYNIVGDKAEVFYTDVLKKYKFPEIEGEKFMNEAYIWNKIALDGYKIRWFNEILIICNYREDRTDTE